MFAKLASLELRLYSENMFKVGLPLVVVKLDRFILSPLASTNVTTDRSAFILAVTPVEPALLLTAS